MARLTFEPSNKTEVAFDFPKLKLEKDERARIVCIEDPEFAFVHNIKAPKIVNGKAETETAERKDKSTYTRQVMDFISRPICLGDLGILQDKGSDPQNCPACAEAMTSESVDAPTRRFAMHVIKYSTKPGSFDLVNPFSVQVLVWAFTDKIFNTLTDFVTEWGPLYKHDLKLGPCKEKTFQQFEIVIANSAAWLEDETRKTLVKETLEGNKAKDLVAFCGKPTERRWLESDLDKVRARWRVANGIGDAEEESAGLQVGLDELLSSSTPLEKPEPAAETVKAAPAAKAEPAASEDASEAPADKGSEVLSFDDLLSSIDAS